MSIVMDRPKKASPKAPAPIGEKQPHAAAAPVPAPACANCRFFARLPIKYEREESADPQGKGNCRRYPPQVHTVLEAKSIAEPGDNARKTPNVVLRPSDWNPKFIESGQTDILLLPIVPADFFCGEYQRCNLSTAPDPH